MKTLLIWICLSVITATGYGATMESMVVRELDSQDTTAAEMAGDIKRAFYEATGEHLQIYLSPEAALKEERDSLNVRNFTLERTLDFYVQVQQLEYKWVGDLVLIDVVEQESNQ